MKLSDEMVKIVHEIENLPDGEIVISKKSGIITSCCTKYLWDAKRKDKTRVQLQEHGREESSLQN